MCIPLKPLFSRHKGAGVQFTDEPTGNLDSKSGKIVIDALKDINEHMGKTIIMVEYYGAAEPPVRCGESHLSGLTEPPHFVY